MRRHQRAAEIGRIHHHAKPICIEAVGEQFGVTGKLNIRRIPCFFINGASNDSINGALFSGGNCRFDKVKTALPCVAVDHAWFNGFKI